jgi:hypothetical protein
MRTAPCTPCNDHIAQIAREQQERQSGGLALQHGADEPNQRMARTRE